MLAEAVEQPFDDDDWLFEVKWDGLRAIAARRPDGSLRLRGRRGLELTGSFPEVVEALESVPSGSILDGELVVLDNDGAPSFERVLSRQRLERASDAKQRALSTPATLVVFDMLFKQGQSLMREPLATRREHLTDLATRSPALSIADTTPGEGRALFEAVKARGLEGIVAKRRLSRYLPGQRSPDWLKIKKSETLWCVVLGYQTDNTGDATRGRDLRSLLIAAPDEQTGLLRPVGRVGASLRASERERLLDGLRAHPRPQPLLPIESLRDSLETAKGSMAWVEPRVLVEVRYLEFSSGGVLRSPVLLRWRGADP